MIVFPAAYFGSIGYFKELVKHQTVYIEAFEHFPKQTYRNRCDILGGDGITSLSIPIKRPNGTKTFTKDILLSNDENWRARHWRSIKSAYQASPYFDHYGIEIESLLFSEFTNLLEFNVELTKNMLSWIDLEITLEITEEFAPVIDNDPREHLLNKNQFQEKRKAPYIQVFPELSCYQESLSLLDTIFCQGPLARNMILPGNH